jgi:hypothetical protein
MLFYFACEAAGATSARLPRALWFQEAGFIGKPRTHCAARMQRCIYVIARSVSDEAIHSYLLCRSMDCFACARNDGCCGCLKMESPRGWLAIFSPLPPARVSAWRGGVGGGGSVGRHRCYWCALKHPPPLIPKSELRSSRPHRFAGGGKRWIAGTRLKHSPPSSAAPGGGFPPATARWFAT